MNAVVDDDFARWLRQREPLCAVHLLIWAVGLVLIDNCDFTAALERRRDGRATGALVVAPLRIPGATGATVNPLLIT